MDAAGLVALGRSFAGLWFIALGAVSAVLILAGALSPLNLPVIDHANFIGYVLWSVWLVIFAILLLLRPRTGHRCARAGRRSTPLDRVMTIMNPPPPAGMRSSRGCSGPPASWPSPSPGLPAGRRRTRRRPPRRRWWPASSPVPSSAPDSGWPAAAGSVPLPWILATALGMGAGLLLGATVVGFGTSLADVAVMGALTGAAPRHRPDRGAPRCGRAGAGVWAVAMPLLWAARLDRHHPRRNPRRGTVHHLRRRGAFTFSALSGILLQQLLPARQPLTTSHRPTPPPGRRRMKDKA